MADARVAKRAAIAECKENDDNDDAEWNNGSDAKEGNFGIDDNQWMSAIKLVHLIKFTDIPTEN